MDAVLRDLGLRHPLEIDDGEVLVGRHEVEVDARTVEIPYAIAEGRRPERGKSRRLGTINAHFDAEESSGVWRSGAPGRRCGVMVFAWNCSGARIVQ